MVAEPEGSTSTVTRYQDDGGLINKISTFKTIQKK
jgi:hypothetical protein